MFLAVTTSEALKKDGPTEFAGTLHERTQDKVIVNAKGRMIKVLCFRRLVSSV
jgi:hypothetical protein